MFKYLTTKNIENLKYQISAMLNSTETSSSDVAVLKNCDNFIQYSKYSTRIYILGEVARLAYIVMTKRSNMLYKSTLMIIRVNAIWLLSNIVTNIYLDKNMPIIKSSNNNFNKYIINKY
jgi:hypothetical protein